MITPQKAESRFHEIEARQQADPNMERYNEELSQLVDELNDTIEKLTGTYNRN